MPIFRQLSSKRRISHLPGNGPFNSRAASGSLAAQLPVIVLRVEAWGIRINSKLNPGRPFKQLLPELKQDATTAAPFQES